MTKNLVDITKTQKTTTTNNNNNTTTVTLKSILRDSSLKPLAKAYKAMNLKTIVENDNGETFDQALTRISKPIRPDPNVAFTLKAPNIPDRSSFTGRKYRQMDSVKLPKVLAFIDMYKNSRFSDGLTVISIACTSKRLQSIFGEGPDNVSKGIRFLIDMGLIGVYDNTYHFGSAPEKNYSKKYVYSAEAEQYIKKYCEDLGVLKKNVSNTPDLANIDKVRQKIHTEFKSFEEAEVRFSSKLHLRKPDDLSKKDFEDYLMSVLLVNYPQLRYYFKLVDELNEVYLSDDPERQIQFRPHFKWTKDNKAVRKIGIRATNSLVSAKKEKKPGDNTNVRYREDILKERGLNYEYDVTSSVPRVTDLMNNGIWQPDDVDFYKEMYEEYCKIRPNDREQWTPQVRSVFKSFHMRGYFDKATLLVAHVHRKVSMGCPETDFEKEQWYTLLKGPLMAYRKAITNTVGKRLFDGEIFLHESCIYLDVLAHLLDSGYRNVLQVYDAFFLSGEIKEFDIRLLVKYYAESYYKKYVQRKRVTQSFDDWKQQLFYNSEVARNTERQRLQRLYDEADAIVKDESIHSNNKVGAMYDVSELKRMITKIDIIEYKINNNNNNNSSVIGTGVPLVIKNGQHDTCYEHTGQFQLRNLATEALSLAAS